MCPLTSTVRSCVGRLVGLYHRVLSLLEALVMKSFLVKIVTMREKMTSDDKNGRDFPGRPMMFVMFPLKQRFLLETTS